MQCLVLLQNTGFFLPLCVLPSQQRNAAPFAPICVIVAVLADVFCILLDLFSKNYHFQGVPAFAVKLQYMMDRVTPDVLPH